MIYRCLVFVCQFLWGSICGQTRLKAPGPTTGGSEFEEAAWPSQAHPSQSTETLVNGIVGIVFCCHICCMWRWVNFYHTIFEDEHP